MWIRWIQIRNTTIYLEQFPQIVELSVDVPAHCHRRVHSLYVALLHCTDSHNHRQTYKDLSRGML